MNSTDDILNKLLPIEKDINNIHQKIKTNLYNNGNLNPSIKNINIKRTTKIFKNTNNPKINVNYQGRPEIFLNDKTGKTSCLQSDLQYKENNNNYKTYIKHKKNMSEYKFSLYKNNCGQNNIDIKVENHSQNPSQTQQINQKNQNIYIQSGNINTLLQQNNSQNENLAQTEYKTQIEYFNKDKGAFPQLKLEKI